MKVVSLIVLNRVILRHEANEENMPISVDTGTGHAELAGAIDEAARQGKSKETIPTNVETGMAMGGWLGQ